MTQYYIALDEEEFNATWHDPSSLAFYETPEEARDEFLANNYDADVDTVYVFHVTIDLDKTYTKTWVES